MKKSQLKQLIREVVTEIAANEPKLNPSFQDVKVGDVYLSYDTPVKYASTVVSAEPISSRFGKPDRVVSVKIQAKHTDVLDIGDLLDRGEVIDQKKKIWVSQLLQGLV